MTILSSAKANPLPDRASARRRRISRANDVSSMMPSTVVFCGMVLSGRRRVRRTWREMVSVSWTVTLGMGAEAREKPGGEVAKR